MKKASLMLILTLVFNGCAHMPDWVLKAHLFGFNKLHPDDPIKIEAPVTNVVENVTEQ